MNTKLPILRRFLLDGWRGQLGWSVGIAAVLSLYLPLFPSLQSPDLTKLLASLPPDLIRTLGYDQISTGTGYTQATFFGLLGFVLAIIAATGWGSSFLAGAEESGRLELTLAHAVTRTQYVIEAALALVLKLLGLGVIAFVLILVFNTPAKLGLTVPNLLATLLPWLGLALLSAAAALAVGAVTGRRSWSVGAGAGIAVIGYILNAVSRSNKDLQWLESISPYHWAFGNTPLTNGFDWGALAMLWGGSAVLIAIALLGLRRRDVLG